MSRSPTGAGGGLRTRVKTAKGRKVGSTRWLERQLNDPYVKRAKAEGYRSRAAYKLIELDERFGFLKGAKRVVDLGIAPGGWAQVVRQRLPQAVLVGIDLLPTDPIDGATILLMDFMDDAAPDALKEALGGPADLVLSDMAANTVGHPQTDHLRTMGLVEAGARFRRRRARARRRLRRQGARGRRRQQSGRRAQAPLHHRQARQAPGQPQGLAANGMSSRRGSRADSLPFGRISLGPTVRASLGNRGFQRLIADRALQHLVADHEGRACRWRRSRGPFRRCG